jgi:hypothetical protein
MLNRSIAALLLLLAVAPLVTACQRQHDRMTPAGQSEAGRQRAQDYPSTRNSERPDPSIGGTNSATSRQDTPRTTAENPTGTGGSGDLTGH